jgi:uncharacterized protein
MKIALDEIRETPRALSYVENVDGLNVDLARGAGDYHVVEGLVVEVSYHRAGLDVFFAGTLRGIVQGRCARCLGEYDFSLDVPLQVVLTPRAAAVTHSGALREEELGLDFYDGAEIDVTPLVAEQALLALPTRPLCAEECRGLCPRCGANLNAGACGCPATVAGGRLAALETLLRER